MKHSHNPETQYDEPASIAIGYSQIMARQLGLNEKNLEVLLERTGLSVEELMDDETLLTKRQRFRLCGTLSNIPATRRTVSNLVAR